jgi:hypothetical protein
MRHRPEVKLPHSHPLLATFVTVRVTGIPFLVGGQIQIGYLLSTPSIGVAVPLGVLFRLPAALGMVLIYPIGSGIPLATRFNTLSLFVLAECDVLSIPSGTNLSRRNF